jgi:hypothetical protein
VLSLGDPALRFRLFKWTVYGLLCFNLVLLIREEINSEVFDQIGWLILLGVFEWESTTLGRDYRPREKLLLFGLQAVAYVIVVGAWIGYFFEGAWPEFINATLWLGVVVMLLLDVHRPSHYGSAPWRARNAVKGGLYLGLVACAVYWAIDGDLLDFYDATLWIVCFAVVELNIFSFEQKVEEGRHPSS